MYLASSTNNQEILPKHGNDNDNSQEFCPESKKYAKGI